MCFNMGFLKKVCSLATLMAIFLILAYILCYWAQKKSKFDRWLNLGASPFLLFQIEIFILQFNFKIFTSCQASPERDDVGGQGLSRPGL